ncbi:hypothetical protein AYO40_03220 [Planctomycetaceae bacterium SCGC AG-212-D15]|nr:hypothetical protein AYO40_03220 [Planctomycetaceae bacterium SCGC AG-212-D15]
MASVFFCGLVGCQKASSPAPTPTLDPPSVPAQQDKKSPPAAIGTATMEEDGTIVLDLRTPAMALFRYPPDDKEYKEILKHLGGLKRGETKLVPPWPDSKIDQP